MNPRSIVALAALCVAGCSPPPTLSVDKAYVRLAAAPGRPAVAYFTIHGGTADRVLIDVSSDVSIKSEMHESMTSGAMATMKPIDQVPVRAGSAVTFAPGGKHVMLFDVNPSIKAGQRVLLTFTFSNNQRIEFNAPAIPAGAPAPAE